MTTSISCHIPTKHSQNAALTSMWLVSLFFLSLVIVRGNAPVTDMGTQECDMHSKPQQSTGNEGKWLQMAIESPDELSVDDFVRKYANTGTPVVLRRSEVKQEIITIDWLKQNCDQDGEIEVFESTLGSPTSEWAGMGENKVESLGYYLNHRLPSSSKATKYYGFEYNTKCSCPDLPSKIPWYSYFNDDVLLLDPEFEDMVWPSLIVGPSGSTSALHVDYSFYPFHLTVISGRKIFRAISLSDWREHLTDGSNPIYSFNGEIIRPVDAFNDDVVEQEILSRGANVFNATLGPGDTVYIPTGALHGAINIGDDPVAAISSNFLNPAHSRQVLEEYCLKDEDSMKKSAKLCRLLIIDPDLKTGVLGSNNKMNTEMVNDFWEHSLAYPGFCEKYGSGVIFKCPHVEAQCAAIDFSAQKIDAEKIAFASGGISKYIKDIYKDGRTSYREFLRAMLSHYVEIGLVDLENVHIFDIISIQSRLQKATNKIWQFGGPAPNVRDLDNWFWLHRKMLQRKMRRQRTNKEA